MTLQDITHAAAQHCLEVSALLHPDPHDSLPKGTQTLLLFGPAEPAFWTHFQNSPYARDGKANPMDRWSKHCLGAVAKTCAGTAIFPSDGPPFAPFVTWALLSGQVWLSPVNLLVHAKSGLFVCFRGAIALPEHMPPPPSGPLSGLQPNPQPSSPQSSPCEACETRPCLTACPVAALTPKDYNLEGCHSHLKTRAGQPCIDTGCAVRRACPISQTYGRLPAQSAFHMRDFIKT